MHWFTWYKKVALQIFHWSVSPQVSTVQRDPRLLLQCQVNLEVFVQQATTVQRAAVCPHPAQPAPTRMRLEEKTKITASHARLVNKKLCCMNLTLFLKTSSLFVCLCQAGSRSYQARESVIHVLLGSTARPWVPAPPALCPAQQATSVLRGVLTVSLSPAPKAPTAPVGVSPPQVRSQNLCGKKRTHY